MSADLVVRTPVCGADLDKSSNPMDEAPPQGAFFVAQGEGVAKQTFTRDWPTWKEAKQSC